MMFGAWYDWLVPEEMVAAGQYAAGELLKKPVQAAAAPVVAEATAEGQRIAAEATAEGRRIAAEAVAAGERTAAKAKGDVTGIVLLGGAAVIALVLWLR